MAPYTSMQNMSANKRTNKKCPLRDPDMAPYTSMQKSANEKNIIYRK